jgi:GntR family transcriptional regulator
MDKDAHAFLTPELVDESLPTPLYHQLFLILRERIGSGQLPSGALLPGEQEMAKMVGVSRITVKRTLNELAARGLVHRHRGRGTTVAGSAVIPMVSGSFDTLLESLQREGLHTDVELLDVREEAAGPEIAGRLEIKPDHRVQRAVRLRKMNGEPFSYLVNYIPIAIARRYSLEELATLSMLTLLERAGEPPQEAEQWISAVAAGPAMSAVLDVAIGSPLLKVARIMRGNRRRPVQFIEAHYRPDRFHYHFRTQRHAGRRDVWSIDG